MAQRLDLKQRAQIASRYEVWRSPSLVQRWWRQQYSKYETLHPETIKSCHRKLMETGSVADLKRSGRPVRTSDPGTVNSVRNAFSEDGSKSLRVVARDLDMSYSSVRKVLKTELMWRPWKPHYQQALYPDDLDRREEFSTHMLDWAEEWPELFDNILWSDEAIFHVGGFVNRHNSHYWAEQNPRITKEKALHNPKITVWCGLTSSTIVGPFFFQETVNGERYLQLLQENVYPAISNWDNFSHLHFMHDGAPPHFARGVRDWLDANFPMKWIGRRGPVEWPARSPDLTPLDFFLWGYSKDVVYKQRPRDIPELQTILERTLNEIPRNMLERAAHSVRERLIKCRDLNGGQVEAPWLEN